MQYTSPPGVFDILPNDPKDPWKNSWAWVWVETALRQVANDFGFREIRTPIFEKTELFLRGIGDETDIVSKEMYTFLDKGERSLTLRPEGTAPAVRAFLENQLHNQGKSHKLFYICPMFRYERAQAGRFRQHHQFGVEAIGIASPEQDAEVIDLAYTAFKRLGVKNLKVFLNSIGDDLARALYRDKLTGHLKDHIQALSEDSQKRFHKNPLRILDSKDPQDQKIVSEAPIILDYLSPESKAHFERIQSLLASLNIPFQINPQLVRGLDYYNNTVFEMVSEDLGSQNSIAGGGRYDGLLKKLGGPDLPSCGFGSGIERLLQVMLKQGCLLQENEGPLIYLIPLGDAAKSYMFKLAHDLRDSGISVEMDLADRKVGKAIAQALQLKSRYALVIGDNEIKTGQGELKELASETKTVIELSSLPRILQIEKQAPSFMRLMKEMNAPFQSDFERDFYIKRIQRAVEITNQVVTDLKSQIASLGTLLKD